MNTNSLTTIRPYKFNNLQWVFDDSSTGLNKEAFVAGADDLLDSYAYKLGVNPEKGLTVTFSAVPFPGSNLTLEHLTEDEHHVGNWYKVTKSSCNIIGHEAWFCPALFLYFKKAPKNLHAKITK
jgi:hypothetical protein